MEVKGIVFVKLYFLISNLIFGCIIQPCRVLAPLPRIKPRPSIVERRVLTAGPPGDSLLYFFKVLITDKISPECLGSDFTQLRLR